MDQGKPAKNTRVHTFVCMPCRCLTLWFPTAFLNSKSVHPWESKDYWLLIALLYLHPQNIELLSLNWNKHPRTGGLYWFYFLLVHGSCNARWRLSSAQFHCTLATALNVKKEKKKRFSSLSCKAILLVISLVRKVLMYWVVSKTHFSPWSVWKSTLLEGQQAVIGVHICTRALEAPDWLSQEQASLTGSSDWDRGKCLQLLQSCLPQQSVTWESGQWIAATENWP